MITSCSTKFFVILYYLISILPIFRSRGHFYDKTVSYSKDQRSHNKSVDPEQRSNSDDVRPGARGIKVQLFWPEQL